MIWRVSREAAQAEFEYGADQTFVTDIAQKFYELMASHKFLPNSPTLMNAGLDNDLQYSACYVLPVEDSVHGIFESVKNAAVVHKSGGGTGFSFSRLRPKGSNVKTSGGIASGPVSFLRAFDGATEAIKQGGRRRGANMGILRVDHPDIEEFITCKEDGGLTNFNISVAITDVFLEALKENNDYNLIAQPNWPFPDGGSYTGGEVVGHKNARGIFDLIVDMAWKTGDPGLIFIDRINNGPSNPTPELRQIEATNPCVTGETLIYTENGLAEARDLYYLGQSVRITADSRQAEQLYQEASPVFSTGQKQVCKLRTKEGYSLRLTGNHKVMTDRGWVMAKNLNEDDKIHILNRKGGFGTYGNRDIGLTMGWLVGDGTMSSNGASLLFYGQKQELVPMFAEKTDNLISTMQLQRNHTTSITDISNRDAVCIQSVGLKRLANMYGLVRGNKHQVPQKIFLGTEAMQRGYLQALFTADGSVVGTLEKGFSVRLSQSNEFLLEQVQRLLLNFGIASKIYRNRRPEGYRLLPDSNRNPKSYWCEAEHELVITKVNVIQFQKEIGFLLKYKNERLREIHTGKRGPYQEHFTARFESLTVDGFEEVYDLTEPVTHSFVGNGFILHNCGEQSLFPYEACNLGSLNLVKFINADKTGMIWASLSDAIGLAIRFLDNIITVNPYPLPEITDEVLRGRRIGLGVMGWADLLFELGIPYDSKKALELAEEIMNVVKNRSHKETEELAKERGPFPDWPQSIYKDKTPRRNNTTTTIAPTGSISIIAGTSSGIEPIFALAFRHIVKSTKTGEVERELIITNPVFERIMKEQGLWNDEIKEKVMAQGSVREIEGLSDQIRQTFVTSHEIKPEWHIRMQAAFQKHTDNGVSKTINLPNSATKQDVENSYLLSYDTGCLGITVFRDGCKGDQVLNIGTKIPKVRTGSLGGSTYRKSTPVGTAYITINNNGNRNPFEVFINVGKAGSDVAADAEGMGRLISLILRLPTSDGTRTEEITHVEKIIGQLRGIGSGRSQGFGATRVMSLPDAVAQTLMEHIGLSDTYELPGLPDTEDYKAGDICPSCGQAAMILEEGCQKCHSCGHSVC